jgi:hypothetical protein
MTDEIDLTPEAVVAMMEGVTPGPWRFVPQGAKTSITDEEYDVLFRAAGTCAPYYDARFIAWAREAVPALSARLAEVEGERDNYVSVSAEWCSMMDKKLKAAEAQLAQATPAPAGVRVKTGELERIVWEAIVWGAQSTPPPYGAAYPSYTDRGNSDAEYKCREVASSIMAALEPAPAGVTVQDHPLVWELIEAVEDGIRAGLLPKTSASEGGAAKYSAQVKAADRLRAALRALSGDRT